MTVNTTINSSQGVVSLNNSSGITLEANTNNSGFMPYTLGVNATLTTTPVTLSAGNAGVYWLSGASAITVVMPDPSTCPSSVFVFRSLTAVGNILSGSGTKFFTNGNSAGGQMTLSSAIGASQVLLSDGSSFISLGGYGTLVFA